MAIKRPESKQPIPSHAKKVFEGKLFEVWQWEQKFFDGSTETFERLKRPDTVNVIPVTAEGKLVLTRQEQPGVQPFIGVLGGRIDKGETPLEAAKRELLEESGYTAEEFVLWDAVQPLGKIDWAVYTFAAKKIKQTQEPETEAGEKIDLFEVSFDEFTDLVAQKNYRDAELALKVLQTLKNPKELEEMRKVFSP